jgi:hypothetical protein
MFEANSKQKWLSRIRQINPNFKVIKLMGYLLMLLAITFGFFTRIFAVFQYVTFDIGPDPDQIRDAFAVMNIWQGNFPTLGPQVTTIGRHHILPLYYYLFFPFTLLGADPVFQALPNALFSFLSIPLLIYLVYQLLENVKGSARIFFSGLAGFWYSLLFGEIFISNFQWNPSSIPFFLMVFTLLYKLQIEGNFSLPIQAGLWIFQGITLAILISLHSSTLFVMPVVFIITSSIFICRVIKRNRKLLIVFPGLATLSAVITLLPYWIGEVGRGFSNTKTIFQTIVNSSSQSNGSSSLTSFLGKIYNLFLNYFKLAQQVYFWNSSWFYLAISVVFLSGVTYLGISRFRGKKYIWYTWCSTWIIYLCAASNIDSRETVFYYKLLILFTPIVLTVVSLAYLDYSRLKHRMFAIFIGVVITFSWVNNLVYDYQFILSKYGQNRLVSTAEITQILNQLPTGSTICDPRIKRKRSVNNQYNYIDTYITHKGIKVVDVCQAGNYVIHPKRVLLIESNFLNDKTYEKTYFVKFMPPASTNLWPIFKVVENGAIERPSKLFLEIDTAYIYLLD